MEDTKCVYNTKSILIKVNTKNSYRREINFGEKMQILNFKYNNDPLSHHHKHESLTNFNIKGDNKERLK